MTILLWVQMTHSGIAPLLSRRLSVRIVYLMKVLCLLGDCQSHRDRKVLLPYTKIVLQSPTRGVGCSGIGLTNSLSKEMYMYMYTCSHPTSKSDHRNRYLDNLGLLMSASKTTILCFSYCTKLPSQGWARQQHLLACSTNSVYHRSAAKVTHTSSPH